MKRGWIIQIIKAIIFFLLNWRSMRTSYIVWWCWGISLTEKFIYRPTKQQQKKKSRIFTYVWRQPFLPESPPHTLVQFWERWALLVYGGHTDPAGIKSLIWMFMWFLCVLYFSHYRNGFVRQTTNIYNVLHNLYLP